MLFTMQYKRQADWSSTAVQHQYYHSRLISGIFEGLVDFLAGGF